VQLKVPLRYLEEPLGFSVRFLYEDGTPVNPDAAPVLSENSPVPRPPESDYRELSLQLLAALTGFPIPRPGYTRIVVEAGGQVVGSLLLKFQTPTE